MGGFCRLRALAPSLQKRSGEAHTKSSAGMKLEDHMNRIMTALALSGLFVAAPAFARVHSSKPAAVAGDKAAGEKTTETKTETTGTTDAGAKPAKKVKKSKKTEKTEKPAEGAAPAEAPATK
jgi:hypothetical protein